MCHSALGRRRRFHHPIRTQGCPPHRRSSLRAGGHAECQADGFQLAARARPYGRQARAVSMCGCTPLGMASVTSISRCAAPSFLGDCSPLGGIVLPAQRDGLSHEDPYDHTDRNSIGCGVSLPLLRSLGGGISISEAWTRSMNMLSVSSPSMPRSFM
jgi:hypothetical protein